MQISRSYGLIRKCLVIIVISFAMATPSHAELTPNISAKGIESVAYQGQHATQVESLNGLASCQAYFKGTLNVSSCRIGEVPAPAALWLFVLALLAFVGLSNRSKP